MSGDTSNSSTEDEEDGPTTAPASLPKRKVTRQNAYKCPDDFVSFTHKPCSSTLTNSLTNKNCELWLIKAPSSFNPQRFNGVAVPLSGLQTVRVAAAAPGAEAASGGGGGGGARQCLYSVLGSTRAPADLHLLTADGSASDRVVCGPAFSGALNVCEIYGDGSHALLHPRTIPAAPAPAIPPGLKQRFLPFGSKMPTLTCVAESELDAGPMGPSSATLRPRVVKRFPTEEEMTEDERRRERKRRKREKRIKTESQDPGGDVATVVVVKMEPVGRPLEEEEEQVEAEEELPFQEEGGVSEERRKKKKRKRDKERGATETVEEVLGEVEGGYQVKKEVTVKCEPVDVTYEDLERSAKKKKPKKRRSKAEEA